MPTPAPPMIDIAPMMGWTNRHGRFLMGLVSDRLRLWTEMISANAILYGNHERLFAGKTQGVVLQIGGKEPEKLALAARKGEEAGFSEINLNMGCPSCRVGAGGFGAAMMLDLDNAAHCIDAMVKAVSIPISVKCRIGVDNQKAEVVLPLLLKHLSQAGAHHFIIHARKAWLKGLSPKQNRSLPPLDYDLVYHMKRMFPHLLLTLNGGVTSLDEVKNHLAFVDGVMIGRQAFRNPFMLADLDYQFFNGTRSSLTRKQLLWQMSVYAKKENMSSHLFTRLLAGLWHGQKGALDFRRALALGLDIYTRLFQEDERLGEDKGNGEDKALKAHKAPQALKDSVN